MMAVILSAAKNLGCDSQMLYFSGPHDALEPFCRLVAVAVRDQHTNRPAPFACEPLVVELVAEDYRVFAWRIFPNTPDRQRTLESLLWVVIANLPNYDLLNFFFTNILHFSSKRYVSCRIFSFVCNRSVTGGRWPITFYRIFFFTNLS